MGKQIAYILQKECFGLLGRKYANNFKEQLPLRVGKAFFQPSGTKCLAWETCTQNIKIRNIYSSNSRYIFSKVAFKQRWAYPIKVCFIGLSSILIYFTCKNTFRSEGMKRKMKTTDAGKQVNKAIWSFLS